MPKKCIFTLMLDGYPKEISDITLPWMKHYAKKIGADFKIINERKFPEWPKTYEKFQMYELGQGYEWVIYVDADALISPILYDVTALCPKDHVLFTGRDMSAMRFLPDKYFLRDGRYIGACNWFFCCSDWTLDLVRPLDDLNLDEVRNNIFRSIAESVGGLMPREQLIDDYVTSRNIAKYGLKCITIELDLKAKFNRPFDDFYFHIYNLDPAEKIFRIQQTADLWHLKRYES
jgi:hypothetical protein